MATKNRRSQRAADAKFKDTREELVEVEMAAKLLLAPSEIINNLIQLEFISSWYCRNDDVPCVYLSEVVECLEAGSEFVRENLEKYKAAGVQEGDI